MLIEVKNLTKIYPGRGRRGPQKALDNVSLNFNSNEIIGLLGVNGSGKTTFSTILSGLHAPTSGEFLFEGKSALANIANYRKFVGYCPQHPTLNEDLTVYDNLYFGGLYFGLSHQESKKAVDKGVEMFGLKMHIEKYPKMLSGGYQQRVMLARALMHDPRFIILDEPTVGLDPGIRKKLWEVILALKENGKSVLLTTHYIEEADILCDRVCILDAGKVLKVAKKHELKDEHQQKDLSEIFMKLTQGEE